MDLLDTLQALLFVADAPATASSLAQATGKTEGQVEQAIELLQQRLAESGPLQIVRLAGGYQLCTTPECAEVVAAFLKPQRQRLGRSLMEVLAVIAYRQPITLAEIDLVRRVQSDYSVGQLVERRLVQEVGRKPTPGRPILYGTTQQFLHQFNMNDLADLPKMDEEISLVLESEAPIGEDAPALPMEVPDEEEADGDSLKELAETGSPEGEAFVA